MHAVREIRSLRNPSDGVFAGSQRREPYVEWKSIRRSVRRRNPATKGSVLIIPEFQLPRGNELARSHQFQSIAAKISNSRPEWIVNLCQRFGVDPDGFSHIRRLIDSDGILNDVDAGGGRGNLARPRQTPQKNKREQTPAHKQTLVVQPYYFRPCDSSIGGSRANYRQSGQNDFLAPNVQIADNAQNPQGAYLGCQHFSLRRYRHVHVQQAGRDG